jgi:proline iminopeptidase
VAEETRWVEVPNARLRSVRTGQGPPMAMLHGGPGQWDYMGPVAATIDDVASVIRYDQRGCGHSTGGPPYDVATAVADLDAVRAAWGVERWDVFGFSWGATLALAYALEHPDRARSLVYVAGTGVDPAWHAEYHVNRARRLAELGTDENLAADLADPARLPALRAWLYGYGFEVNREANQQLGADADRWETQPDLPDRLRRLEVPTLVVHGERDPRPIRFAVQLAELLPNAELYAMPNVGHFPRFEAPGPFTAVLRGFLGRLTP